MKRNNLKFILQSVMVLSSIAIVTTMLSLLILTGFTFFAYDARTSGSVEALANNLKEVASDGEQYELTQKAKEELSAKKQWCMLLNQKGEVIWSYRMPKELPLSYSIQDIASFTRWYLEDYPVSVWSYQEGLFVCGKEKGSVWKYSLEYAMKPLQYVPMVFAIVILVDLLVIFLISIFFMKGWFQKRDRARTEWIAGISHDIRTPLTISLAYSCQIEENQKLPQDVREQAGVIRMQSEKIGRLVKDFNLVSKLEYGMQPFVLQNIKVIPFFREILTGYLNRDVENHHQISFNVDPLLEKAEILADADLLKRAITNLIDNCFIHNQKGCSVTISLRKKRNVCQIMVTDDGKGYPRDILEKFAVTDKMETDFKNRGLGLSIVFQIIKNHKGSIRIYNSSEGSVCEFELKIRNEK